MATTPEQEVRNAFIYRLRLGASVLADPGKVLNEEGERTLAIDMNQAANEIEDLAKLVESHYDYAKRILGID